MEIADGRVLGTFTRSCCILLVVFLTIAVILVCISLWLCIMGFELNLLNLIVTTGFLVSLSLMSMASTDLVVLGCGMWSLFLVLYYWISIIFLNHFFSEDNFLNHFSPRIILSTIFLRGQFSQPFFSEDNSLRAIFSANKPSKIIFRHFPKKLILSTDMNFPTTTTKTTLVYLSALTGVNLVLIMSSDWATVVCGYVCLVLSISSLVSFYLSSIN